MNLKTNKNLSRVREEIKHQIQQLKHIGDTLPKSWVNIRRELERIESVEEEDYISLERYLKICQNFGLDTKERALHLSQYLHDLGAFLHFQEDKVLKNLVILKNEWATDAVYTLLDDPVVKDRKMGRFNMEDVRRVWSSKVYEDKTHELLELMMKYKYC